MSVIIKHNSKFNLVMKGSPESVGKKLVNIPENY